MGVRGSMMGWIRPTPAYDRWSTETSQHVSWVFRRRIRRTRKAARYLVEVKMAEYQPRSARDRCLASCVRARVQILEEEWVVVEGYGQEHED